MRDRRILLSQIWLNLHRAVKCPEPEIALTSSDAGECGGGQHADGEDRAQHLESRRTIAGRDGERKSRLSRAERGANEAIGEAATHAYLTSGDQRGTML